MTRNMPAAKGGRAWARNASAALSGTGRVPNITAAWSGAGRVPDTLAAWSGAGRAQRPWCGTLCALCLLLCTALLAACAPEASDISGDSDVPGISGALDVPDISNAADPGLSAAGTSGSGIPGTETSLSGAPDAEGISAQDADALGIDLSGNTADNIGDGEDICRLPLAPDSSAEFPEPDRAAILVHGAVALHLDAREFVLGADNAIGYTIENTTGHSVGVAFVPQLERWTDGAWEGVPCSVGFCGMPDPIDETYSDSLPLEWFPGLTEGVYRLTYTLGFSMSTAPDGHTVFSENHPFSACFYLRDP